MRKYKINRNTSQKIPSKETIEKYKDFSRLSHSYDQYTKKPKQPIYKDKRMFLFILLVGLLAYLLVEAFEEEKKNQPQNKTEQAN